MIMCYLVNLGVDKLICFDKFYFIFILIDLLYVVWKCFNFYYEWFGIFFFMLDN